MPAFINAPRSYGFLRLAVGDVVVGAAFTFLAINACVSFSDVSIFLSTSSSTVWNLSIVSILNFSIYFNTRSCVFPTSRSTFSCFIGEAESCMCC